jgi:hypothetical protein
MFFRTLKEKILITTIVVHKLEKKIGNYLFSSAEYFERGDRELRK